MRLISASRKMDSSVFFYSLLFPNNSNIYTFDVHTRRIWLIYKKIFTPEIKVGVIAHKSSEYSHRYLVAL